MSQSEEASPLGTVMRIAFRNVTRNKFRAVLTILGVAVSILTFILLRTVLTSWTRGAEASASDLLITRHRQSLVFWMPLRYVNDIKQLPGIANATPGLWFGGADPKHEGEFFATIALDPNTYFDVDPGISITSAEREAMKQNRKAAIIGDSLATKFGWKVGDHVTLETGRFPSPEGGWTFDIVAIYQSRARHIDRESFYLNYAYVNDTLPAEQRDRVGWVIIKVQNASATAETSRKIDALFATAETPTLTVDERAFQRQYLAGFAAVLQALDVISLIIIAIMLLILGNTIAMGVRERSSEYATFRAIGFQPRHVVFFVLFEALFIGLLGGILGIALAYPLIRFGVGKAIEENLGAVFPYFRVEPTVLGLAIVLAAGLGLAAAMIPAFTASRTRIVDALRKVA